MPMQGMCGSLMVHPRTLTQLTSLQRLELVRGTSLEVLSACSIRHAFMLLRASHGPLWSNFECWTSHMLKVYWQAGKKGCSCN